MSEKANPEVEYRGTEEAVKGFHLTKVQIIIAVVISVAVIVATGLIAAFAIPHGSTASNQGGQGQSTQPITTAATGATQKTNPTQMATSKKPTMAPATPYTIPSAKPTTAKPTSSNSMLNSPRLPTNVIPIHYWLTLTINLTTLSFSGDTTIQVNVTSPTNMLIVHADDMQMTENPNVTNNNLYDQSTTYYPITEKGFYKPNQYYYMTLKDSLVAGIYYIRLKHSAKLSTRLDGLYKYQYVNDGVTYWGVGSQCEPFDARRIIPCFDEPALKAIFTTKLITNDNVSSVLTNMHLRREVPAEPGQEAAEYHDTVVMSTYLLAFSITDFGKVENDTKRNTKVRIWARKEVAEWGKLALDSAIIITEYFEELFGINYMLPKQDHVAATKFDAGAMENWGLILYREEILIYNEKSTDGLEKQRIVSVIAHEIAHMWFGNLVTMEWWNNLWLNEAFASYYEYVGNEKADPSMKCWEAFLGYDMQRALPVDQSPFSHPIVTPTQGPLFDRITYQKGASVLRMLHDIIGETPLVNGLKAYLQQYQYSTATAPKLLESMTKASGYNIYHELETWIYQMGYPVLTVKRSNRADLATITQQRFLLNKTLDPTVDPATQPYKSPYGYKWNISVTYFTDADKTVKRAQFNLNEDSIEVAWPTNGWIKVNKNTAGFYRVMYENENWKKLAEVLNAGNRDFSPTDRAGLIYDALTFAESGRIGYDIAIPITSYLGIEDDYIPWYTTYNYFMSFQRRLVGRASYQYFAHYYMQILMPQVDKIGFNGDGVYTKKVLRNLLMDAACYQGYSKCITDATNMLKAYMNKPDTNTIPADLRDVVYRYGIMYGGSDEWNFLYEKYAATVNIQERNKILPALSYTRSPQLISQFLDYTMNPDQGGEERIEKGKAMNVITYLSRNPVARPILWAYVVENKDKFMQKFKTLRTATYQATYYESSDLVRMQVEMFFAQNPEHTYAAVKREKDTFARIADNKRWLETNEDKLVAAFKANIKMS